MRLRPEIQALRAVAVLLVVIGHYRREWLPGGYVGVDVFFVISGFLITSHLLREVEREGTIGIAGFWMRRAKRILPAALVVLAACLVAVLAFVPELRWEQFLREIRASALYVENWQLAHDATDYFASAERPSPVQHFWSLSVEEQFYLAWPLLLLGAARFGRRAIVGTLATVTAISFAYSVYKTGAEAEAAYFVTPTRAWEFGVGGLLALLPVSDGRDRVRAAVSWLGLLAIFAAAFRFNQATAVPGWVIGVPVLGAVAVIWAGTPRWVLGPTRVLAVRPVQYVGDISYSVYLWHWPLLMLVPYVLGHEIDSALLVPVVLLLAALTKRFVEDPVRYARLPVARRPSRVLAGAAVASLALVAGAAAATVQLRGDVEQARLEARQVVRSKPRCLGAASRDPVARCHNAALDKVVVPRPLVARGQDNFACRGSTQEDRLHVCPFGVRPEEASRTVLLVGDSHAAHWRAGLDALARERGWRGYSLTHTGCPFSATVHLSFRGVKRTNCREWNEQVQAWVKRHPEVETVIVAAIAGGTRDIGASPAEGYRRAWAALPPTVKRIVVIRDTPKARGTTDDCVEQALEDGVAAGPACRFPRRGSLPRDPAVTAAKTFHGVPVQVVNMTRFICDARWCYPVVGGVLVYKDPTHLTETFSRTLGPFTLRQAA